MRFNCIKATEPLRGDSLLLTTQSPGVPGTHSIDLGKVKGWVDPGATQRFWTQDLDHYSKLRRFLKIICRLLQIASPHRFNIRMFIISRPLALFESWLLIFGECQSQKSHGKLYIFCSFNSNGNLLLFGMREHLQFFNFTMWETWKPIQVPFLVLNNASQFAILTNTALHLITMLNYLFWLLKSSF